MRAISTGAEIGVDATRASGAHVIRSLRKWMDEGVLVHGQPLPSERALSEELGVNRKTVRRALAILEEDGVLRSGNGSPRVVHFPRAEQGSLLGNAIVVLTRVTNQPWTEHQQSGWEEYVTHGAIHAIRAGGLNSVSLQPERLSEGDVSRLVAARPRGVVITDFSSKTEGTLLWARSLREAGIPVVIFDGGEALAGFDRVASDHEDGSYRLTRWLIESGRRRILPVWWSDAIVGYWYGARRAGYERAMREAGLRPADTLEVPSLKRTALDEKQWMDADARHLAVYLREFFSGPEPVEALMLDSDGVVGVASRACGLCATEGAREVALAGYDNYWEGTPGGRLEGARPLVTVDKKNLKIGQELVTLLLERLGGTLPREAQVRMVTPEVVAVEQNNLV